MSSNSKNKKSNLITASVVTILATVAIVAVNMFINNPAENKPTDIPITGYIEFFGGHDCGEDVVYVNPLNAVPVGSDHLGIDIKVFNWWITTPGENEPLYKSQDNELEDTLRLMRETSPEGMYILQFHVEAQSGEAYKMGQNFYIIPDDSINYEHTEQEPSF